MSPPQNRPAKAPSVAHAPQGGPCARSKRDSDTEFADAVAGRFRAMADGYLTKDDIAWLTFGLRWARAKWHRLHTADGEQRTE